VRRLIFLTLLAALCLAAPAVADRKPSKAEKSAIKAVSLEACGSPPGGCRFHGARISTAGARFAWGDVTGEGFSGVLVKRPSRRSHRFRVVGTQGGGIGECRYWRARAPRSVLRDLRISGLVASGDVRNCGKRR
jgi:hypothetical protein